MESPKDVEASTFLSYCEIFLQPPLANAIQSKVFTVSEGYHYQYSCEEKG
jgi:hypothetical protein